MAQLGNVHLMPVLSRAERRVILSEVAVRAAKGNAVERSLSSRLPSREFGRCNQALKLAEGIPFDLSLGAGRVGVPFDSAQGRSFDSLRSGDKQLVADVAPRRHALLNVENQSLRAIHPIALAVLADDFLRQAQCTVLCFF